MTDLIGKRFRLNGNYVGDKWAWREGKIEFVNSDHSCDVVMDTGELLGVPLEWLDIIEEKESLIGKRVRINGICPSKGYIGLEGEVLGESVVGDDWSLIDVGSTAIDRVAAHNSWFDIIEEEDMEETMLGKRVEVDGKKGVVLDEQVFTMYVKFEEGGGDYFLNSEVSLLVEEDIVQDNLTYLQKLCTTNNIHILVSKNDYQIWDEHSDDTYEMDNADDVMKAIECLNELKKWRQ